MIEAQIKHMVDRFLSWKLPKTFNPDGGVSYSPPRADSEPVGTNLFTATEADAMVRHMLDGLPEAAPGRDELQKIHSALDDALGDTDVSHIESDEELRDEQPVQWAAQKLAALLERHK